MATTIFLLVMRRVSCGCIRGMVRGLWFLTGERWKRLGGAGVFGVSAERFSVAEFHRDCSSPRQIHREGTRDRHPAAAHKLNFHPSPP
jgi:hypothetical protein